MTVIIAVRKGREAAIAADTQANLGDTIYVDKTKLVVLPFGIAGFSGGLREAQVIAACWDKADDGVSRGSQRDKLSSLATSALALSNLTADDTEILVLTNERKIWIVDSALGWMDAGNLAAVGSGGDVAIGAAQTMRGWRRDMHAPQVAREAVREACRRTASCGLPVIVKDV